MAGFNDPDKCLVTCDRFSIKFTYLYKIQKFVLMIQGFLEKKFCKTINEC